MISQKIRNYDDCMIKNLLVTKIDLIDIICCVLLKIIADWQVKSFLVEVYKDCIMSFVNQHNTIGDKCATCSVYYFLFR